jgi:transcriptional regulator with XRE-family HTH domain
MRTAAASSETKALAKRIATARGQKGLSVAKLAELAGVSRAYIHQIENGECPRPSAQVLFNIAAALGTSIAHLLGKAARGPEPGAVPIPGSLREFAAQQPDLKPEDVEMLARIRFRGGQPQRVEDWGYLWETIRRMVER